MVPILNRGRPTPTVFRSVYFINNTPIIRILLYAIKERNGTMLYRSKLNDNNLIYTSNTHMHLACFPSPFSIHLASNPCTPNTHILGYSPIPSSSAHANLLSPQTISNRSCKWLCKMLFYTVNCPIYRVEIEIKNGIGSLLGDGRGGA